MTGVVYLVSRDDNSGIMIGFHVCTNDYEGCSDMIGWGWKDHVSESLSSFCFWLGVDGDTDA